MDLRPPNADLMEIQWTILAGPSAFVTVTDKVCIDCWPELDQKIAATSTTFNLAGAELTNFMEHTVIRDPEEQ